MLPELAEIKSRRKALGITQMELSKQAGVSQSLIAKIESGNIVPSYSNAKKLFDFFEMMHKGQQLKAKDFMTQKVISVKPESELREAIKLMEKNSVSQLPVISDGKNLGTISEKNALEHINSGDAEKVLSSKVENVMEEAMPQITEDTPFELISSMLAHYSGVSVVSKGKIAGIITKADLLKAMISKKQAK